MKKIALILSVLMMVAWTYGTGMAKDKRVAKLESLQGQVVSVDTKAGKIVVMCDNHKKLTLRADPKILGDFATGEKVSIEKSGKMLKSIKKVEVSPPAVK